MVWAFDTLGYSKRLREAGVPTPQAEGHAEAAREFIMTELVTRQDLLATKNDLQADLGTLRTELRTEIGSLRTELRTEIGSLRTELRTEVGSLRTELRTEVGNLRTAIDTQTLRLTVRLGGIVAAGFGMLAVAIGTMSLFLRLH
jgi:hypothetical protein